MDASLLMMTAGRVFRISLPNDGSKLTHQTSPLIMRFVHSIGNDRFGPGERFSFSLLVGSHFAVGGLDIIRQNVRASELFDELADVTPADVAVKAFIDCVADSDGELAVHWRSLYVLYTCMRGPAGA